MLRCPWWFLNGVEPITAVKLEFSTDDPSAVGGPCKKELKPNAPPSVVAFVAPGYIPDELVDLN
tara:strand:- start:747 stop:938 length:192 start_codon:yes stop_codon:yes gene_type:complete